MTEQQKIAAEHREASAKNVEAFALSWLRSHCPNLTLGDADEFARDMANHVRQGMREALEIGPELAARRRVNGEA